MPVPPIYDGANAAGLPNNAYCHMANGTRVIMKARRAIQYLLCFMKDNPSLNNMNKNSESGTNNAEILK